MKKLLSIVAFALLTISFVGCDPEDLTSDELQEQATDKDCIPGSGDKCDQ